MRYKAGFEWNNYQKLNLKSAQKLMNLNIRILNTKLRNVWRPSKVFTEKFVLLKEAILEILKAVEEDPKLKQLKETCSNDMLKYIQTFVPYSMDVQCKIIGKYGFTSDNAGKPSLNRSSIKYLRFFK